MSPKILVVDLETTSTNPQRAHILEVGLVSVDLATGLIEPLMDTLVCPESGEEEWLDCWFMANCKLDPELIRRAPKFAAIRQSLQEHLLALPVTAFNRSYDVQVLFRHQVQVPQRAPCLMLTCKDILCLPGRFGDYKYPKFSEAWREFFPEEPFEEKHRAGYDALCEATLALTMYERGLLKFKIDSYGGE
ncbi:MAG: exonuclease domain-containing protein [Chloroflexota bacterium]